MTTHVPNLEGPPNLWSQRRDRAAVWDPQGQTIQSQSRLAELSSDRVDETRRPHLV